MTTPRHAFAAVLALICAFALTALAEPAPPVPPPAHAAFALIVTNNRSGTLGRPDLQYADDDGARYYELFRTLAPTDHLRLLTEFDRDTAREFPQLATVIRAPSHAQVAAAAAELAAQIATAERAGQTVDFYFVFAGHGDVDQGRGFIELTDGAFDGDALESLIAGMHATHAHVILDSCNSFFVISARKPGGKRFATPDDAATGIASRLPNVGVFVSTSAEAEVFEWSELQSGVFSHAVRSGLAGAADADGDGVISYDELRAFVDTATSEIRNASFRPKVYARGPGGNDRAPLWTATIAGPRLTLAPGAAVRLTVRDRDELPWIDVYKEAGAPLTLRLPPALASASVDELDPADLARGEPHAVRRIELAGDPDAQVALADAPPAPLGPAARGPDELFRKLFTEPFGPAALARYDAERAAAPPPVFGIAREDAERMVGILSQVDDEQRERRQVYAAVGAVTGAAFVVWGAIDTSDSGSDRGSWILGGVIDIAYAGYHFYRAQSSEHLHADLVRGLATSSDPGQVVVDIDRRLHKVAAEARHDRHVALWVCGVATVLAGGLLVVDQVDHHRLSNTDDVFAPQFAVTGALALSGFSYSLFQSPIERTVRTWDDDPGIGRGGAHLGIAPVDAAHGVALSLGGRF